MSISKKRSEEIDSIPEEQIDYSDIPELDESFWARAALHMPEPKKGIYIRLDPDILTWLKSKGKGYQTRLNAMLRALMEQEQRVRPERRG
jgi:uncharacterized protein (DUF4415 family)